MPTEEPTEAQIDAMNAAMLARDEGRRAPMHRTHFARLNTLAQVTQSLEMLESICDGELADLMRGSFEEGFLQVFAPDGDCVFAALEKAPDAWMCRFHKEVFEE